MNEYNLGILEKVDVREIWIDESKNFTPWLAEQPNIKLLGDTIGMELEVESVEKDVGPFRADIVCKNTLDDNYVVIENQLERTDHGHLGQLLTYAAGLDAVTIIWISKRFTDEHRAALDWLNEITGEDFNFFGLEIEAWRIGASPAAPKFNVVCKPNDWVKRPMGGAPSEPKELQYRYWLAFDEYLEEHGFHLTHANPRPRAYMEFSIGKAGFQLTATASYRDSETGSYGTGELRAEFLIRGLNAKLYFETLQQHKEEIESELGEPLQWYNPEEALRCIIYLRKPADIRDEARWPEQHAWLMQKIQALHHVFAPRIRQLASD